MTFLVRKMRTTPGLAASKVVVVTDRTQLQGQLSETMELSGEHVDVAKKVSQAKTYAQPSRSWRRVRDDPEAAGRGGAEEPGQGRHRAGIRPRSAC